MIDKSKLKELIDYKAGSDSPTLSVYLDIDQSDAANLNRMFEVALYNVLREIEETLDSRQLSDFKRDSIRVLDFVESYRPQAKGLVIFCDSSEDFFSGPRNTRSGKDRGAVERKAIPSPPARNN